MLATVILCTHNRSTWLVRCLEALLPMVPQVPEFEILVVANACSDDTADRVRALQPAFGTALRLITEPRPGLSLARNVGATAARGEFLIYLDDDAIPAPGWMAAYRDYFRAHPTTEAGGGPILPDWAGLQRPSYWRPEFEVNRARLELAPGTKEFPADVLPFGANMFLHAEAFRRLGGFDPSLGMTGKAVGLGEEVEWFLRFRASGHPLGYVEMAPVSHWVNPRDTTRWGLIRRAYSAGVVGVRVFGVPRPPQGWSGWFKHSVSALIKCRMNMGEAVYLTMELGRLREWEQRRRSGQGAIKRDPFL